MGVDHVVQSKIQSLRREFENLAMKKDEKVSDFLSRFTKIISELRDLGERLEEKEAVVKLLRSMPVKYDSLTFSLEQFGNMRGLSVDEVIGSLRVHEQRLQETEIRGKKIKSYLPEPIISPRRPIKDLLQEEEEEERAKGEEEAVDEADLPRMTKRKKRESRLISQK